MSETHKILWLNPEDFRGTDYQCPQFAGLLPKSGWFYNRF